MTTQAQLAADLASAAANRLDAELETEIVKSARTAKQKARDQLLEAAYNLATGNVPVPVADGWLIKSRSIQEGKLVSITAAGIEIPFFLNGMDLAHLTLQFYATGGKTYHVSPTNDLCTCEGGKVMGNTCWHMCACEFWTEAGAMIAKQENNHVRVN